MLEPFAEVAKSSLQRAKDPVVSNLSGELLSPEQATDPAYWVTARARAGALRRGVQPSPPRAQHLPGARPRRGAERDGGQLPGEARSSPLIPTLRDGRPEPQAPRRSPSPPPTPTAPRSTGQPFSRAAAQSESSCPPTPSRGSATGSRAQRAQAISRSWPQRRRAPAAGRGDRRPRGRGPLLTGRLSLQSHPWLADHAVPAASSCPAPPLSSSRSGGPAGRTASCSRSSPCRRRCCCPSRERCRSK